MKEGRRPKPAPAPQTLTTKAAEATVPTAADRVTRPHWSGCPYGCAGWHDHPPIRLVARCNFCTSLDVAAREALHDCSSVCPLLVGEAS
jgi:hypothetical protein